MPQVYRPTIEADVLNLTDTLATDFITKRINPFWVMWGYASVFKHFEDRAGSYPVYLEGDERTLQSEAEFFEVRMDGPFILNGHKGSFFLDVEINVLLQTHMDPKNLYKDKKALGYLTALFTNTICIYKLGESSFDDGSVLGAFHLQRKIDEKVDVNHYGIIKENTRILQSTIEGHYRYDSFVRG
jgi:hypothetical protein